jgi:hypothetical protein
LSKSITGFVWLIFPVFLQLFGLDFCLNAKKPAGFGRRRASGFFDLSGRLHQAIAIRRHGGSMMMVMTVMAAALHLIKTI